MKNIIGAASAAAALWGLGTSALPNEFELLAMQHIRTINQPDFNKPKRRKTGRDYPHSNTRQRARYARQIAAGKLNF